MVLPQYQHFIILEKMCVYRIFPRRWATERSALASMISLARAQTSSLMIGSWLHSMMICSESGFSVPVCVLWLYR